MRRVAVTGMGVISALGHNSGEFRESLFAGKCGILGANASAPFALPTSSEASAALPRPYPQSRRKWRRAMEIPGCMDSSLRCRTDRRARLFLTVVPRSGNIITEA